MKKIAILLPYKENFTPKYAGAVSLLVKDISIKSKYKKKYHGIWLNRLQGKI